MTLVKDYLFALHITWLNYGINKNEETKKFLNSIVEVGTVGLAAKAAISALKAIPGINIGAAVLNAIIAGSIVAALAKGQFTHLNKSVWARKRLPILIGLRKSLSPNYYLNL